MSERERMGRRHDPVTGGIAVAAVLTLTGFVQLVFAWRGVARTLSVGVQFSEVISGGIAGLALIGAGAVLATAVLTRRAAAAERAITGEVAARAVDLAIAAPVMRDRARSRKRP